VGHVKTSVAKEFLEFSIFHSVLVHDGGGGEAEFVGGAVFDIQFLAAFL